MGCGSSKRSKKRNQEVFSDPNNDSCSNSYSGDISSTQIQKQQVRKLNLRVDTLRTEKFYCYNCGNKILPSEIFCANCGVKA